MHRGCSTLLFLHMHRGCSILLFLYMHRGCSTLLFLFDKAYSNALLLNATYFIPPAPGFICFSLLDIVRFNVPYVSVKQTYIRQKDERQFMRASRPLKCLCFSIINSVCLSTAPTTPLSLRLSLTGKNYLHCYVRIITSFIISIFYMKTIVKISVFSWLYLYCVCVCVCVYIYMYIYIYILLCSIKN
jgi:hypothetical protein